MLLLNAWERFRSSFFSFLSSVHISPLQSVPRNFSAAHLVSVGFVLVYGPDATVDGVKVKNGRQLRFVANLLPGRSLVKREGRGEERQF